MHQGKYMYKKTTGKNEASSPTPPMRTTELIGK